MYSQLPFRFQKIEEELERLEHPLNDEILWLLGVASALLAIAELSTGGEPDLEFIPEDYDA